MNIETDSYWNNSIVLSSCHIHSSESLKIESQKSVYLHHRKFLEFHQQSDDNAYVLILQLAQSTLVFFCYFIRYNVR